MNFADDLRVYVKPTALPTIGSGSLQIPLQIRIDNPSRESFRVSQIVATVYERQADGTWSYIASSSPAMPEMIIKAADTTIHTLKVTMPVSDAVLNVLNKVFDFLSTKKTPAIEDYRVKGHLVVEGIKLPFDHFTAKV